MRRSIFNRRTETPALEPRRLEPPSAPPGGRQSTEAGRIAERSSRAAGDPDALDLDPRRRKAVRGDGSSITSTAFMDPDMDSDGPDDITDNGDDGSGDDSSSDVGVIYRATPTTPVRERVPGVPAPEGDSPPSTSWLGRLIDRWR